MDPEFLEGGPADLSQKSIDVQDMSDDVVDDPEKSRGRRWMGFFERNFLKLLFAFSLLIAWFEYDGAVQDKRVRASFDLVQNWEQQGYVDDFRKLETKISILRDQASARIDSAIIADERALMIANFVRGQLDDSMTQDEQRAFDRVVYFFNKAGLCSSAGICDTKLLEEFFGHNARVIRDYFDVEISRRRKTVPNYANYALKFADQE